MPDDIDTIDATAGGEPPEATRVEPVDLQTEMQRSYLDYSMSVIVSRALPDVRDGLKPVHRRVLYAMYDGGYRPDRNFSKSARVVGDVMGNYHPHGDSAIYDALVRLAQPWSLRYPLVQGQGNFGSPGNDPPAAQRYTECRMAQLAMETVRDIDEETVDFAPNYDGRTLEPTVLPSRFPNLLVNGSAGIAVGMATNIPPHNLREVAEAATWLLNNPEASTEERLTALLDIVQGPDFPTGATIIGKRGIEDAYRTGRGSITMRAVVEVDEDAKGRQRLIVTELPYQVNPDNLLLRIAELVGDGKLTGISDVRDDSSSRTGMRLIIDLKRDAVAQVVLNQLYKHTQLQDNFGANMLALVDGVPRTLTLEQFLRYWIAHQIEVIQRRTRYRLRKAEERTHILRGYLKALDALDDVIALIRASATVEDARTGLMELLEIDELQATAILDMQLRRLAAMERQKIIDEYDELMTKIADYNDILTNEPRQRSIVSEELGEIVGKYGDDRRTEILPWDGEVTDEDLIAEEDVVVTITSGGYAKRTRSDLYRAQRRGGRGVRGAALRQDDVVEHFMVTSTHNWLLFFTNQGRIYRAKGYQLPDASRDAKGQHVANLLAFRPEETIASVLSIPGYDAADYLVLATRSGQVKKTRLSDYDTNRQGGIIAINLAEDDEVIGARLVSTEDDIFLASTKGMSVRFTASDEILRPMGRDTRGVIGMRFREGDSLLSMDIVRPGQHIVTITDGGFAKRTLEDEWTTRNRGILGVRAMKIDEKRGSLVAAMICDPDDQIFAIASNGVVIRTAVSELRPSGRDTMGVTMMRLGD
ncbi:MAG: DNA gyrase subunit A, partial [Actinomycetota bacterium]